ncbi:DUF3710 domain-containing protein [Streptomyces sp. H10-C2]|uniref:DUF3710 domain-containing protein n=1 Tax=unclassified Streptomyces TaxID=2593676 RepID=UPI0024BB64D6|nr:MULTISPECIES: DUF3710 domain-containing protein [unclassified Streptomyces]MDJ0344345.1 DUF3710 domain-containing protein [Streptomyces sp. PH10-H1]MDJ0373714.1 DUF3710 domain-containing protein [Streptomyces sp. H10-C2]
MAQRGRDAGPWDASEADRAAGDHIDLGGLRIPSSQGLKLRPVYGRRGDEVEAVGIVSGRTALQLQAFRAAEGRPWNRIRGELLAKLIAGRGEAKEWAGPAGVEIRSNQPVTKSDGSRGVMAVRFLGCDGPGWLLRGVVTGEGAAPDSTDQWAFETFMNTIVDPTCPGGSSIELKRPQSGWS